MADSSPSSALSPERYLAWLYSQPEQQPVLAALCQIEAEIAGSLKPGIDHHVAHARLQWWREECERTAQGRPAHPLTRELLRAFRGAGAGAGTPSSIAGISGFVDTAVWDLAGATFETRKELTAYCERWATAMFETAAAPSSPGPSGLRELGSAVREVELLTGLAREAHVGRLRVPLDELEQAGIDLGGLAKPPWPAALETLLRERHAELRATIASSVSQFARDEQPPIRGLLVWAALAYRLSWRAQRALPNVISPRRYHALSDGWHAWRAAHRATTGKLRLN
jgi:phytoene synthase